VNAIFHDASLIGTADVYFQHE